MVLVQAKFIGWQRSASQLPVTINWIGPSICYPRACRFAFRESLKRCHRHETPIISLIVLSLVSKTINNEVQSIVNRENSNNKGFWHITAVTLAALKISMTSTMNISAYKRCKPVSSKCQLQNISEYQSNHSLVSWKHCVRVVLGHPFLLDNEIVNSLLHRRGYNQQASTPTWCSSKIWPALPIGSCLYSLISFIRFSFLFQRPYSSFSMPTCPLSTAHICWSLRRGCGCFHFLHSQSSFFPYVH